MRKAIISFSLFHRWEKWDTENLCNLSQITASKYECSTLVISRYFAFRACEPNHYYLTLMSLYPNIFLCFVFSPLHHPMSKQISVPLPHESCTFLLFSWSPPSGMEAAQGRLIYSRKGVAKYPSKWNGYNWILLNLRMHALFFLNILIPSLDGEWCEGEK